MDITVLPEWRSTFNYNHHNFAPSQLDFCQAKAKLEKELAVPSRQEQQQQIAQHQDPALQDAWRRHFAKQERTLYEEACMHYISGDASVC